MKMTARDKTTSAPPFYLYSEHLRNASIHKSWQETTSKCRDQGLNTGAVMMAVHRWGEMLVKEKHFKRATRLAESGEGNYLEWEWEKHEALTEKMFCILYCFYHSRSLWLQSGSCLFYLACARHHLTLQGFILIWLTIVSRHTQWVQNKDGELP